MTANDRNFTSTMRVPPIYNSFNRDSETVERRAKVRRARIRFSLASCESDYTLRRSEKRRRSFKVMDYVARKHRPRLNRFKNDDGDDDDGAATSRRRMRTERTEYSSNRHSSRLASSSTARDSPLAHFRPTDRPTTGDRPTDRPLRTP